MSSRNFLRIKFRVKWLFRSGEVQDGECGGHSGFSIRTNLAILISKSLRCFLPSFKSLDFLDGDLLVFPIKTTLAIFDLLVVLILPTKFQVNWPLGSGEEAKNRFSRWRPSLIFDRNGFSSFWPTNRPDASYQVPSQSAFRFRRRSEN